MDVLPGAEGRQHALVVGHVRHDAQLDLRVVHREQHVPRRGDEALADAAPLLGADGDVLQVRVGRGEPPGDRAGLAVGRVHASGRRVHGRGQRIDVGGLQLGELAVLDDQVHHRMLAAQHIQDVAGGGVVPAGGLAAAVRWLEAQPVEEHLRELLRGVDVEGLADRVVDLLLDLAQASAAAPPPAS